MVAKMSHNNKSSATDNTSKAFLQPNIELNMEWEQNCSVSLRTTLFECFKDVYKFLIHPAIGLITIG